MNVHSSSLKVRGILNYLLGIKEQHPYNFLKKGIVFTFLTVQIQSIFIILVTVYLFL